MFRNIAILLLTLLIIIYGGFSFAQLHKTWGHNLGRFGGDLGMILGRFWDYLGMILG